jgi:hypothetical protein
MSGYSSNEQPRPRGDDGRQIASAPRDGREILVFLGGTWERARFCAVRSAFVDQAQRTLVGVRVWRGVCEK